MCKLLYFQPKGCEAVIVNRCLNYDFATTWRAEGATINSAFCFPFTTVR